MKIIFCIPSQSFGGAFFDNWFNVFLPDVMNKGIKYVLSRQHSPVYYYARNASLGGNVLAGKDQKPWQSQLDYDFIMWIDSDIIFNSEHIYQMCYMNKPIVAGYFPTAHNKSVAPIVETWDEDAIDYNYRKPLYMSMEDIRSRTAPFPVEYSSIKYTLFKKGVIEKIEYPWFQPIYFRNQKIYNFENEQENIDFCIQLKEKGFQILVNPKFEAQRI